MKKKEEQIYFDKEWKSMRAMLKSYLKDGQQEDLHHFRVQVKKLRAFLIMADSAQHRPKLTIHFKPVRRIFKRAGQIRDAYLNLELGKANGNDSSFMDSQQQLMEQAIKRFIAKSNKYPGEIKAAYQNIKEEIESISDIHINLYYEQQLEQVAGLLATLHFDERLHECRKLIKILMYNYKFTHKVLNSPVNEEYLDQVQAAIGEWHDNTLSISLFSDYKTVAALKNWDKDLRKNIAGLVKDFNNRAETVVGLPLEQID
jgi:CHAD domain-containing protein